MLLSSLNLLAQAPNGVARLRELILTLAVQGKLVPQDPKDEPASALLKKIRAEKDRLIAAKTLKREKDEPALTDDAPPFDLPVTWGWVALGEVIDIVRGITFPATQKTREAAPGRIACLRTTNVQQTIEWEDLLFVDRSFMGRADQLIQHHDIVMSMANSRELVGKVALIDQIPHAEATFGGFLGVLRPRKIDPLYAMAVLRTPYARSLLIDSSSQTTNIANVSLAKLRPLPFPLPPEAEQSRIVTRVEELMRLCDALEAKGQLEATQHAQLVSTLLATLTDSETPAQLADNWHRIATHFDLLLDRPEAVDALEQAILQLAVRGLLVPQDPQDEPASELLKKIRAEKDKLIAEGKIKRDKPLPPIAEDEQLPMLPRGWEDVRLGDLIELVSGQHLGPNEYVEGLGGRVPYLTGPAEFGLISPEPSRSTNERRAIAIQADILITVKGSGVGKLNVVTHPELAISRQLMAIRPVKLDSEFLMVVLQTMALHFQEKSVGIAIPGIGRDDVTHTLIGLPPLAEQSRIVTRVAQLRHLCADLRQRLSASQS
ncbi:MAG TPA: restriction endonuclease subunit S, partial [Rhodoferax sp.]|nr:restriction endonuclease subunit S [Rhodoferax sp.]